MACGPYFYLRYALGMIYKSPYFEGDYPYVVNGINEYQNNCDEQGASYRKRDSPDGSDPCRKENL